MVGEETTLREAETIVHADGECYVVNIKGSPAAGGQWIGWIEFRSADSLRSRRTDRETTQPNRDALLYWATGLEPIYFEGAFARAH